MTTFHMDMFTGIDTKQKLFTDAWSVALALRMINAFNVQPKQTFIEVKDPLGERVLGLYPFPGVQGFQIPVVIASAQVKNAVVDVRKYIDNPDVVCVLMHSSFRKDDVQWIVIVMKDRASAQKLTEKPPREFGGNVSYED